MYNKILTEKDAKMISNKLLIIVVKIHIKGISHRDIKPENIMIWDRVNVVIIDLGLADNLLNK
jgi:serine/threonine-protein kinase Chk1